MSKVDLTSLEWCELIFKDRNKNYGAYKMRRDLGRRQTASLVIVTVVAFAGFTLPRLVKMAMPEQKEEMVEVTQLSALEEPEVKEETLKKVEPIAPPPPALKSTIKFTAPVIKKDEEVHDDDELKSQDELTETKVQISIADVKGNDELNGKDIADLQEVITQAPEAQEEEPYMMVEQMPQFPGGPAELLKYIAKNHTRKSHSAFCCQCTRPCGKCQGAPFTGSLLRQRSDTRGKIAATMDSRETERP